MYGLTASELFLGSAVVLVAFVIRGISGFGSGIILVPPLALMLPLHTVVPVVTLLNYIASLRLGMKDLDRISWRELGLLAPSSVIGMLIALYLFRTLHPSTLTTALGVFVMGYAVYTLTNARARLAPRIWAVPAGFLGGLVDMLFSAGGPIYVMYLSTRKLDKTAFRATISVFLVAESTLRLTGYAVGGFFRGSSLALVVIAVPVMAAGVYIGEHIHTRISQNTFARAIGVLLLASGAVLLAR